MRLESLAVLELSALAKSGAVHLCLSDHLSIPLSPVELEPQEVHFRNRCSEALRLFIGRG